MNLSADYLYFALTIVLGFVHLFWATSAATKVRGVHWNVGNRDQVMPALNGIAGRLERAWANYRETYPLFLAAAFILFTMQIQSIYSSIGIALYFWARLIYLGLYARGIVYLRSLVWFLSVIGIFLILVPVFMR